ncbi:MAG: DUF5684 domain-containing protein, partial [candidate division SR1 bacterium]|nr:DUF5684 domain-containing protein [candidate division SR1 bacterium]
HAIMNYAFEISGAVASGNISPEAIRAFGDSFGNMGGVLAIILGGMSIMGTIIMTAIAVFMIISRWRVFEKAGLPGRGIFIPFYNFYLMFELGGRSGWHVLWILVFPVFCVLMIINNFKIAKRFGKPGAFGLGIRWIKIVFIPILAFDKSIYTPLKK